MVIERGITIEGKDYIAVISDENQALLAAQAAGRAVVGVEGGCGGDWSMKEAPYVVPSFDDATEELLELVVRRYLGLPWHIGRTRRLLVRELVKEDALLIPEEEYGAEEALFRSPEMLELYRKNQYGFYEYGTWALVRREDGALAGLAGVTNPSLPDEMETCLKGLAEDMSGAGQPLWTCPWLELGYHIFRPWRRRGYAAEAARAIAAYSHEVLGARLCALVHRDNQASRRVAEGLGMKCVMEIDTGSSGARLLYAESPVPLPDKAGP